MEPDTAAGSRAAGHWLRHEAAMGHPHPMIKLAVYGAVLGRAIYDRVPGGGEKRCTACGHQFR